MFLCCGWHISEFWRQVSLMRILSRAAKAGISQKIRPSASISSSLFISPSLIPFFCSCFLFFLNLFLSSASFQTSFSFSVSGVIWLINADFPVSESRATNVKLAVRATASKGSNVLQKNEKCERQRKMIPENWNFSSYKLSVSLVFRAWDRMLTYKEEKTITWLWNQMYLQKTESLLVGSPWTNAQPK